MSTKFYTLLTDIGAAKLVSAAALGVPLKITHMAVGDGGGTLPTPDAKQSALVNEKRRAALNMLYIDPQNSSQIIAEQVIPENEGGWWIREVGLFDESGALIAVGNCPESYKPQLAEGSGRKPVFQWIGDKVQALWGWFTDLLTPVKSTSAELQSAAAMGRRFGEALAEGLNMVMHPLDSLKSGVSWLLEKLGIVSKEAAKAKLPESVTRQQPATVNADGKVMMPSGGFPSWGYGFAGMYDSGGYIPRRQFGIVGENGPEIVNGPANVTSRRNTAALAAVVAGMMGVAAAPAELPPLHPLALPAKGGEAIVSRAATVPLVQRIEAPTQIIIQTQPGQSAQDIAREVARQLDERERRLKAKARSNYSDQGGYDA